MTKIEELKKAAGVRAANEIESGMLVGLGTGSTAAFMLERLAERIRDEGLKVTGVSTSWSTTLYCRSAGIPLLEMGAASHLDLAIDGADEIDPARNLIKGRGAAHLLEKIVASMADRYLIVADSGKRVQKLGEKFPVPLEVIPGAVGIVSAKIAQLGGAAKVRMGAPGKDGPVISDSGNLIVDAKFPPLENPGELAAKLDSIAGLVGHGLFIGMASKVILATESGLSEF